MSEPVRLRLSRAKGFSLQELSRATNGLPARSVARPGPWGNPFVVGKAGTAAQCVQRFAILCAGYICLSPGCPHPKEQEAALIRFRRSGRRFLAGLNLACYCAPDRPCHADVLLMLVNSPPESKVDLSRFIGGGRR